MSLATLHALTWATVAAALASAFLLAATDLSVADAESLVGPPAIGHEVPPRAPPAAAPR